MLPIEMSPLDTARNRDRGGAASKSALRVIQNDNAITKPKQRAKQVGTATRRKVHEKTGTGIRKKKAATSTKLPKIAK